MIEIVSSGSIAREVDERLLSVQCPKCHRYLSVTIQELRKGWAIPCPNCEAWIPLWDAEGVFQGLYDVALAVDNAIRDSKSR